ncbi:MAG: T9SS type A sorting domain-containing protein [Candidatus Kapabacteria bacterium]|nr:T9SS type A sorting domain-containing protein [Candidatus Kapabacteria bacterium]
MKKLLFLFIGILLVSPLFIAKSEDNNDKIQANPYKYILFNNFDTEFADAAYGKYFTDEAYTDTYAKYAKVASFSTSTFSQYKITDYDLAIFPLGDLPLNANVGGLSILQKIREMIEAGKNVMITGRKFLYYAFDPGSSNKSTEVQKFLTDTLGIRYVGVLPFHQQQGSTLMWWSFWIRGDLECPIGKNIVKWCNIGFNAGNEVWWPLANYLSVNVFQTLDRNKFSPVDHVIRKNNAYATDTLVGIKAEWGKSRIAAWSMGFEGFAGDIPRGSLLYRAMVWLLGNIPPDGPVLSIEPLRIDFGHVPVDSTRDIELELKSIGTENLIIKETSWWEEDPAFSIVSGEVKTNKPVTLKKGQSHKLVIRFSPKVDKKSHSAQLSVYTNSIPDYRYIDVVGTAGKGNQGPIIATNYGTKINFGQLKQTDMKKDIDLYIRNDGDMELNINYLKIEENDDDAFNFHQVVKVPISIKPKDSVKVIVRFSYRPQERIYKGLIKISSDAFNAKDFFVELEGEIIPSLSVDNWKFSSEDGLLEIWTYPNPFSKSLNINYSAKDNFTEMTEFSVFDLLGNKLYCTEKLISAGNGSFKWDIDLGQGLYYLIARQKGNRIVIPIVSMD